MIKTDYDIIGELLPDAPVGKNLYHYTSYEGLVGIFEQKTIRCTHIFYLNDLEENLNAWGHFFDVLISYEKEHVHYPNFKKFIEGKFANFSVGQKTLSSETFRNIDMGMFRVFVFSLSEVEDDLNQWRSYTPNSFGFSINFKFDETLRTNQQSFHDNTAYPDRPSNCKIFLKSCIYKNEDKLSIIKRLLDYYFDKYTANDHDWENELFFNILTLSPFFKNEKYSEEKECRLVVSPAYELIEKNGILEKAIKFRRGKNFIVPYIELDTVPNCIKAITIGPTPFEHHSKASLQLFIRNQLDYFGLVDVKNTTIPFRSW